MISWAAILSLTKLAPHVKVAEAAVEADAGVAVMAAEVVAAVGEEAVVVAADAAVVVAAATGAGNLHPTTKICNQTGEPAMAVSPVLFSGLPGISLSSMLSLGYSYGNAICRKHPRRSL
jgi:hypothetical protein